MILRTLIILPVILLCDPLIHSTMILFIYILCTLIICPSLTSCDRPTPRCDRLAVCTVAGRLVQGLTKKMEELVGVDLPQLSALGAGACEQI